MRDYISKYKWQIVIFLLICLVLIPLAINVAFKLKAPCAFWTAEWNAGDVLSFYGTLLGSVATIIGVYMSIQYAQKSYKDDIRNQVLPFFAVTQLRGRSNYNAFLDGFDDTGHTEGNESSNINPPLYEESKLSKIYFCLETSEIKNYIDLPSRYVDLLEKSGASWTATADGCYMLQTHPFISFPMEIENVGKGPAIYVRIGFFKNDDMPKYLPPVNLKAGEKFYIHIFSAIPLENTYGKYELSIQYQDIYKNSYMQEYPFVAEEKGCHLTSDVEQICKSTCT